MEPPPPAEFWGMEAIPARMGVATNTLYRWHQRQAFPLLRRGVTGQSPLGRLRQRRLGRPVRFTTEALIQKWYEQLAAAQWTARYGALTPPSRPPRQSGWCDRACQHPDTCPVRQGAPGAQCEIMAPRLRKDQQARRARELAGVGRQGG
jgi:hypothetical protein